VFPRGPDRAHPRPLTSIKEAPAAAHEYPAEQWRGFAMDDLKGIPGTPVFTGSEASEGLALNKMCFSFNAAANREEFLKDEEAYMNRYGLNDRQKAAIRARNVLQLIAAGGNVYYLAKFAGIFGLSVQDIGAQQTGMTIEAFKAHLAAQGV
jgi:protocatechuate 4,5-dioxygenase alpha chain